MIYTRKIAQDNYPHPGFNAQRDLVKIIFTSRLCQHCKISLSRVWKNAWVSQALRAGHGEAWCSLKCLKGSRAAIRRRGI